MAAHTLAHPKSPPAPPAQEEEDFDIFDSALCALFSVPPIGFSTASASDAYEYTPPSGPPVKLWLPHPPASEFAALQANNLWLSGVFLADRLCMQTISLSPSSSSSSRYPGKRLKVAELGAGAGLPGIMAARAGAAVVSSDYDDPVVVRTLRKNFASDFGPSPRSGEAPSPIEDSPKLCGINTEGPSAQDAKAQWAVLGHSWGTSPAPLLEHSPDGFDAIILADTIWSSDKHGILLDSVCALLRRPSVADEAVRGQADGVYYHGGVVHLAAGLHTGRGPIARFLTLAQQRGLIATAEDEVSWLPGGGWGPHEYRGGEGEERGVVVYYTLRWAASAQNTCDA